ATTAPRAWSSAWSARASSVRPTARIAAKSSSSKPFEAFRGAARQNPLEGHAMLQYVALLAFLIHPSIAPSPAISAQDLVKKVQSYYGAPQKLRAKFRQEYTTATFGRTSSSDGLLRVAKPGKMRWDYDKPEPKYFIADGTTLWVYEPSSKQALQQSLKDQ